MFPRVDTLFTLSKIRKSDGFTWQCTGGIKQGYLKTLPRLVMRFTLSQNVLMTVEFVSILSLLKLLSGLDIWVTKEDDDDYILWKNFSVARAGQYKPIEKDCTIQAKIIAKPSLHNNNSQQWPHVFFFFACVACSFLAMCLTTMSLYIKSIVCVQSSSIKVSVNVCTMWYTGGRMNVTVGCQ